MVHSEKKIVFVTFESEFSKFGGLGAVMGLLPPAMIENSKDPASVLAPLFPKITKLAELKKEKKITACKSILTMNLSIGGQAHQIEVLEVKGCSGVITWFISTEAFFNAPRNVYVNPCDPEENPDPYRNPVISEKLTEDALFFSAAVPPVLVELHRMKKILSDELILHLQDWETAAVVKALQVFPTAPQIQSIKCVLTLHNPYDRPLTTLESSATQALCRYLNIEAGTLLEQCLPAVACPLSTVSRNFARELTSESLHTRVFAPHLQKLIMEKGLTGIDNGLFGHGAWPFSDKAKEAAQKGDFQIIVEEKEARKNELNRTLKAYQAGLKKKYSSVKAAERAGIQFWGKTLDLSDPGKPVFMIMGRDDPRQKGYDVIVEAIRKLRKNQARFIFTPNPGDEGLVGLQFLKQLTKERASDVIALPYRLDPAIFSAIQKGCSYMVMGSLYEPFGAATEAYLAGMPVVARATGGLIQQVMPLSCSLSVLSQYGRYVSGQYHADDDAPTGILYREKWLSEQAQYDGWRCIVNCDYWQENPKGDRIQNRKGALLFDDMVNSAAEALQLAIDTYQTASEKYAAMIYHGYQSLSKFSWKTAVQEYQKQLY